MARINKISITLCALLFALPYTPLAQASEHVRHPVAQKGHPAKTTTSKSNKGKEKAKPKVSTASTKKKPGKKDTSPAKAKVAKHTTTGKSSTLAKTSSKKTSQKLALQPASATVAYTEKCTHRKGHKKQCVKVKSEKNLTIAQAHKVRVQKAQKTAMNKLMGQIGKPYRWGGTSPRTGFDCSGLIYYAYKDLVNIRIPRTANEMYHLRDASSVDRGELESGDLVFFRTQGRGTADHVGVYVGNGKFIQSPRSGRDIQITSLSEDYWQRHYVGARRVMTPKTIR